jgi:hypothetical protein
MGYILANKCTAIIDSLKVEIKPAYPKRKKALTFGKC